MMWAPGGATKASRTHADTGHKVRKLIKRFRGEKGQALVELAFVIPLVLLFLFGIIDFGLALNQKNEDTNIANIAVREAAIIGTTTTALCGTTTEHTLATWTSCEAQADGSPAPTKVCVFDTKTSTNGTTYSQGDPVEVKISSHFSWLKLIQGDVGPSSTLGANATMREEGAITSTTNTFLANPSSYSC